MVLTLLTSSHYSSLVSYIHCVKANVCEHNSPSDRLADYAARHSNLRGRAYSVRRRT